MRIDDGFRTIISLPAFGLTLWEKEVTPPGLDGGGPVDTTTMRNINLRTKNPKHLYTMTDMKVKAAYDPLYYDAAVLSINVNQLIIVIFPNLGQLAFWGYLDKFDPDPLKEGEQPTANVTIVCTNQDTNGVEMTPNYIAP